LTKLGLCDDHEARKKKKESYTLHPKNSQTWPSNPQPLGTPLYPTLFPVAIALTPFRSQVLPLLIVFALLGVGGWVGYQVYISVAKMQDAASERMGKKNVVFTKDGVKVGVKQIKTENYVDATQSWVVKAWNLGTTGKDDQRCAEPGCWDRDLSACGGWSTLLSFWLTP
jgi:hypothetical protein